MKSTACVRGTIDECVGRVTAVVQLERSAKERVQDTQLHFFRRPHDMYPGPRAVRTTYLTEMYPISTVSRDPGQRPIFIKVSEKSYNRKMQKSLDSIQMSVVIGQRIEPYHFPVDVSPKTRSKCHARIHSNAVPLALTPEPWELTEGYKAKATRLLRFAQLCGTPVLFLR